MHRTAVLLSAVALLVASPAGAAEPVPEPTVVITVKVAGEQAPKATSSATWTVREKGGQAQLDVDARNLPGMVTVVEAVWTSPFFRVYPKVQAFEYNFETSHLGAPSSSMAASVTYGLRYREGSGRWTPWYDQMRPYAAGITVQGLRDLPRLTFPNGRKQLVQLQFRVRTELEDASRELQVWKLLAST